MCELDDVTNCLTDEQVEKELKLIKALGDANADYIRVIEHHLVRVGVVAGFAFMVCFALLQQLDYLDIAPIIIFGLSMGFAIALCLVCLSYAVLFRKRQLSAREIATAMTEVVEFRRKPTGFRLLGSGNDKWTVRFGFSAAVTLGSIAGIIGVMMAVRCVTVSYDTYFSQTASAIYQSEPVWEAVIDDPALAIMSDAPSSANDQQSDNQDAPKSGNLDKQQSGNTDIQQ